MPYVNIRITNEAVTPEKKATLIKGLRYRFCNGKESG